MPVVSTPARLWKLTKSKADGWRWATEKTWTDCRDGMTAVAKWALAAEGAGRFPPAVRDKAAALQRLRWRCIKLQPDEVEWLVATLKDSDLRDEGPWVRDHLKGVYP